MCGDDGAVMHPHRVSMRNGVVESESGRLEIGIDKRGTSGMSSSTSRES